MNGKLSQIYRYIVKQIGSSMRSRFLYKKGHQQCVDDLYIGNILLFNFRFQIDNVFTCRASRAVAEFSAFCLNVFSML